MGRRSATDDWEDPTIPAPRKFRQRSCSDPMSMTNRVRVRETRNTVPFDSARPLPQAGPPRSPGRYARCRVSGGLIAFLCVALVSAAFTTRPAVVSAQAIDAKTLVLPPTELEPGWQVGTASGNASAYDAQYINTSSVQMAQFSVVLQPNSDLARQVVPGLVPPQQKDSKLQVDTLNPTDLGDGPTLRFTLSSSDSTTVGYAFRVGPVALRVLVGAFKGPGQPGATDLANQALRYALRQQARVRSAIASLVASPAPPPATPTPTPAQSPDPKLLVVGPADLGPEWQVGQPGPSGDATSYEALYVSGPGQVATRAAEFSVVLASDAELARALVVQQALSERDRGYTLEEGTGDTWQLGDSPVFHATRSTTSAAAVGYALRIGTVAIWVGVAAVPGQDADLAAQALRFAHLEEARVRSALASAPNAPSGAVVVPMATPAPTPVPPLASVDSATYCPAGQSPRFTGGFAALQDQLGDTMGQPLECEHPDSASGDTLQRTTTGLAFYRKSSNTPTFTDGSTHWALTPDGAQTWTGDSIDPPPTETVP